MLSISDAMTILAEPDFREAEKAINDAIFRRRTLLLVGDFSVYYTGRARSKLQSGERVLIVKGDGSVLIHRSLGYEPVNWQPAGSIVHARARNALLEVRAIRHNPEESLRIVFTSFRMVSAFSLTDSGEFALYASEQDMQKAVLLKPSLLEEGFRPVSYERKTDPGFVDVYGIDQSGKTVVVEIKRKSAGKNAVLQLARYVEAIKGSTKADVRGILAAPGLARDAQRILATLGLEFKALDPKKCANVLVRLETRKLETFFARET
jgi:RecB family endonuclease NucS